MEVIDIIKTMEATGEFSIELPVKSDDFLVFIDKRDHGSRISVDVNVSFSDLMKLIYQIAYDNGYNQNN